MSDPLVRIWRRTTPQGDCLVYEAPPRKGRPWEHPRIRSEGRQRGVHVLSYEAVNGPVPPGLILRHTCDQRGCVNPDHLVPGTRGDNTQDMVDRGRVARGVNHSQARLTTGDIGAILLRRATGETFLSIANDFGVSRQTVARVCHGETYQPTTR